MSIYLDSASTTRPYQEVADVVYDVMLNHYGNASSVHGSGYDAKNIVESVRNQIAEDINCLPEEIIFTSGASESNALAFSAAWNDFVITSKLEHKSISNMVEKFIFHDFVNNDQWGNVYELDLENKMSSSIYCSQRPFVSIQAANSEIGTIQDLTWISHLVHKHHGIFHTDATQLYPYKKIDVNRMGIDLMSVSAQKMHGPKGIGFLYVKNGTYLRPLIYGTHEKGIRGGTYNTPLIAGMGKALEITRKFNVENNAKIQTKRDRLMRALMEIDGVTHNGVWITRNRLINNISITVQGVNAHSLVTLGSLYGLEFSAGSACSARENKPSSTLKAIGLSNEDAFNTIRLTIDEFISDEEIDQCIDILPKLIARYRQNV